MNYKYYKAPTVLNDKGFSLVELIISIAILVIVMVPLMSNFVHAIIMNKRAEDLQTQSDIATNIMEGLKNINIDETIKQFDGTSVFNILPVTSGNPESESRLTYDSVTGNYEGYQPEVVQEANYFAINGIKAEGSVYDAIIKMDPLPYRNTNTMNNYQMPDLINLDSQANGLLLSSGENVSSTVDYDALTVFLKWGKAYARKLYEQSPEYQSYLASMSQWSDECETANMLGNSLPTAPTEPAFSTSDPDYQPYMDEATVTSEITKTIHITVSQDTIVYNLEYQCEWPTNDLENSIITPISQIQYHKVQNVYLFYVPSIFDQDSNHPDKIKIENQEITNLVNIYVAKQKIASTHLPYITIDRSSAHDNLSVFTNLGNEYVKVLVGGFEETDTTNPGIVKTDRKDRIYDVTIQICQYAQETKDKYKKVLYTLRSTREK